MPLKFYVRSVAFGMAVIQRLMSWLADLFAKIHELFRNLWNWIKAMAADVYKRVKEFVSFLQDKINGLMSYLFG